MPPAAPVLRKVPAAVGTRQLSDESTVVMPLNVELPFLRAHRLRPKSSCGGDLPQGVSMTRHRVPLWAAPASGRVSGPQSVLVGPAS